MKIGTLTRTYCIEGVNVDYARMKRHGFDYADFSALDGRPGGFLDLPEDGTFENALQAEREKALKSGIEFSQVHGVWPTDDTTAEMRAFYMERHKKSVRGTAILGCKYLVIHPLMPYGWEKEDDPDWVEQLNEEFFKEICAYAADYNVDICIENMPMKAHRLSRTPKMAEFVRRLNLPNLFMCFDTGHANVYKDNCGEMVRLCGDMIKTLHVHDNCTYSDEHIWPYSGRIDWDNFMQALKDIGYKGALSSEACVTDKYPPDIREYMEIAHAKIILDLAKKY